MSLPQVYSTSKLLQGLVAELVKATPKLAVSSTMRLLSAVGLSCLTTTKGRVTPAYLTTKLREKRVLDASTAVTQINWTPIERGALAAVYRITIAYSSDKDAASSGAPFTAIVKVLGEDLRNTIVGSIIGLYNQECKTLTGFRDRYAKDLMPKIYASELPWYGLGFYVMEDYGHLRHRKSRGSGMTLEEVCKMAAFAGTLHARTFLDAEIAEKMAIFKPLLMHAMPHNFKKVEKCKRFGPLLAEKCPKVFGLMKEVASDPTTFFGVHNYNVTRTENINVNGSCVAPPSLPANFLDLDASGRMNFVPFTIVHGDCRLDNAFFDMSGVAEDASDVAGELRMIDWQVCMPRAPMAELMWMLAETDIAVSCDRAKMDQIFETYLDSFIRDCKHPWVVEGPLSDRTVLKKLLFELPFVSSLYHLSMVMIITAGAVVGEDTIEVLETLTKTLQRVEAMCEVYLPRMEDTM